MVYEHKQKFKTRRPRTVPWGKIVSIVVGVALIYFGFVFGPPYWRSWKVHSILQDESAKAYSKRHQKEGWEEILFDVNQRVTRRLRKVLGIPSRDLFVAVKREGKNLTITARWRVEASYPLIGKKSVLKFKRTVKTSLK